MAIVALQVMAQGPYGRVKLGRRKMLNALRPLLQLDLIHLHYGHELVVLQSIREMYDMMLEMLFLIKSWCTNAMGSRSTNFVECLAMNLLLGIIMLWLGKW